MAVLPFFKAMRHEDSDSFISDTERNRTTSQPHTSETSEDGPHFSRVPSIKTTKPYPTMSAANISHCANDTNALPIKPPTTDRRPDMPIMPFTKPFSTNSLVGRSDGARELSTLLDKRAPAGTDDLDMSTLPLTSMQVISMITPPAAQMTTAGPDVSAQSTVPFSPPLRMIPSASPSAFARPIKPSLASGCRAYVQALETPTVSPIPSAPGQFTTMKFIQITECDPGVNGQASVTTSPSFTTNPSGISTVYMKGSPITMSKGVTLTSTGTTFVTAIVTGTSTLSTTSLPATTTSAAPGATATPAPGKHGLSKAAIGLISTASVLSLIVLVILAYILRRYIRKRKEAQHEKTSSFWHKLFAPTHPAERAIPLTEVPGTGPSPFRTSMSDNPYRTPDPGVVAAAPPKRKSPFNSIKAAMKARGDPTSSDHFPMFTSTYAERQAARERARSGYPDTFCTNTAPDAVECGFGGSKDPFDMVEICLAEDVALEEEEKAERRRQEERATWDAPRRSMSPYPTNPFRKVAQPPQNGVRTLI
ncbi:hypothetical protein EPUS_06758 [Endocarpon pusillum Z07020]|uniref:Mid2 domain-containing protein n=1 Tax=Endocarpon pusillum (strain Z07020 / HMAS-L-300199) TaxID=1263415 RepID=U1G8N2_ENDPU|nr:uncharacterized protein EPUS_06758 [Endocarpon pusillum Z07020]ERF68343.1 hypothetical protein EPUS_06758 [Endocarpon pusillum Z07020]